MASTIGTDPTAFATYAGLANNIRKRIADGTFVGYVGGEEAAIADTAVGLIEKSSNPLSLLLDAYASPRGSEMFEKSFVVVGDLVGGA